MLMAHFKEKTWADYDIGDPTKANQAELSQAVRKAAKAANQRLLRLERAGLTGAVYNFVMSALRGRKRFKENPQKMTINELRKEYVNLRSFLSSQTSTKQGYHLWTMHQYDTARAQGFTGSAESFKVAVEKAFSKGMQKMFSSETIRSALISGTIDLLQAAFEQYNKDQKYKGEALLYYMKLKKNKKKPKTRKAKKKKEP